MSGRLSGVVSLTDVLNLYARASGLSPHEPDEARRRRRGSSASASSNANVRASMDSGRSASSGPDVRGSEVKASGAPRDVGIGAPPSNRRRSASGAGK